MKNTCLILFGFLMQNVSAQNQTTIYLIRHAEKADLTANPDLSEAGKLRAANWAKYFEQIPIDACYATPYKRTQQTCEPISILKNKPIITYQPREMDLKRLIAENPGKTLLIVGHSNTIPGYVNALLGSQKYLDFDESEFGNLIVVLANGEKITAELFRP